MQSYADFWGCVLRRSWSAAWAFVMPNTFANLVRDGIIFAAGTISLAGLQPALRARGLIEESDTPWLENLVPAAGGLSAVVSVFAAYFIGHALLVAPYKMWKERAPGKPVPVKDWDNAAHLIAKDVALASYYDGILEARKGLESAWPVFERAAMAGKLGSPPIIEIKDIEGFLQIAEEQVMRSGRPRPDYFRTVVFHNNQEASQGLCSSVPEAEDRITYRRLYEQVHSAVRELKLVERDVYGERNQIRNRLYDLGSRPLPPNHPA